MQLDFREWKVAKALDQYQVNLIQVQFIDQRLERHAFGRVNDDAVDAGTVDAGYLGGRGRDAYAREFAERLIDGRSAVGQVAVSPDGHHVAFVVATTAAALVVAVAAALVAGIAA